MSRTTFISGALSIAWLLLPATGPGCASSEEREFVRTTVDLEDDRLEERVPDAGPSETDARDAPRAEEPYALRVNRTLLYPVQWGRAEDLAETLRPLIEASYGPGTVVVAHPESNHLLIYLPPRSAREPGRSPNPPPPQAAPPFPRR